MEERSSAQSNDRLLIEASPGGCLTFQPQPWQVAKCGSTVVLRKDERRRYHRLLTAGRQGRSKWRKYHEEFSARPRPLLGRVKVELLKEHPTRLQIAR